MTSTDPHQAADEPAADSAQPARKRRLRILATAATIVVLVVGLLLTYLGTRPDEDPALPPTPAVGNTHPATADGTASSGVRLAANTLSLDPIGVLAPIVDASVIDGVLTPPANVHEVGTWLDGAPLDSATGTTLLAGHVNMTGQGNGALFDLGTMKPGQEIRTSDAAGNTTQWRVTSVVTRAKADGIEESVLAGPDGPRLLAVVTCGGELQYTDGVGSYADNVYLYAAPM
ncbi:class F sortase [Rhodococcus sp. IEGM 1379]|uniref:class F sortase n=1 Tax=Rhodococcus sp. IEGM 1379 TaxID=3047086 RepID=UPI0024B714B0|nr:class F sortase [Rhodococcus sp. IEGM 1379]MDI9919094.1 class F sortase [Rhodococcus sp. IEGM 1379]